MSRRLGILLALGGLALAIFGVWFVSLVLRQLTAPPPAATQVPAITVPVLVTTRALPVRHLLVAGDVTVVNMPVEFAPLEAASAVEDVVGTITMIPMASGEIVMRQHLADPTNISRDLAFIIEEDQVVMAFPAEDLMSQVDVLQSGDLVDILVSVEVPVLPDNQSGLAPTNGEEPEQEEELFTFNALQRVSIQAIVVSITRERTGTGTTTANRAVDATPQPTATPGPEEVEAQAILLALAPQDALVLKHLVDAGGIIDIVLRAPTADQVFELDPVTNEYLKDRYELVPETEDIVP
jgi:pilus assembly protein CpaB